MKTKIDKSLKEVWDMKENARNRFLNSDVSSYAEYLKIRQKKIDEYLKNQFTEKKNYVVN